MMFNRFSRVAERLREGLSSVRRVSRKLRIRHRRRAVLGSTLLLLSITSAFWANSLFDQGAPGAPTPPTELSQAGKISIYYPENGEHNTSFYRTSLYYKEQGQVDELYITSFPQGGRPDFATVAVFRLSGGAQIDESTVRLESDWPPNAVAVKFSRIDDHTQQLTVSFAPTTVPARGDTFTISARMARDAIRSENARTSVILPSVEHAKACGGDLADLAQGRPLGCSNRKDSAVIIRVVLPDYRVQVDYANFETLAPGDVAWDVNARDWTPNHYSASFVNLIEEAYGVRLLFISSALIGIATALFPLGLDYLWRAGISFSTVAPDSDPAE